jgi:hypothetical protein
VRENLSEKEKRKEGSSYMNSSWTIIPKERA